MTPKWKVGDPCVFTDWKGRTFDVVIVDRAPHGFFDWHVRRTSNDCENTRRSFLVYTREIAPRDATTRDSAPSTSANSNVVVAVSDTSRGETNG